MESTPDAGEEGRREEDFDPSAPCIGPDGLEYASAFDYLTRKPVDCWRNQYIQRAREEGQSEAVVREWIEAFDGEDRTPSYTLALDERLRRSIQASFAIDKRGRGLLFDL